MKYCLFFQRDGFRYYLCGIFKRADYSMSYEFNPNPDRAFTFATMDRAIYAAEIIKGKVKGRFEFGVSSVAEYSAPRECAGNESIIKQLERQRN